MDQCHTCSLVCLGARTRMSHVLFIGRGEVLKCCVVVTFSYPLVTAIYPADKHMCQRGLPVHLSPVDALMHI